MEVDCVRALRHLGDVWCLHGGHVGAIAVVDVAVAHIIEQQENNVRTERLDYKLSNLTK